MKRIKRVLKVPTILDYFLVLYAVIAVANVGVYSAIDSDPVGAIAYTLVLSIVTYLFAHESSNIRRRKRDRESYKSWTEIAPGFRVKSDDQDFIDRLRENYKARVSEADIAIEVPSTLKEAPVKKISMAPKKPLTFEEFKHSGVFIRRDMTIGFYDVTIPKCDIAFRIGVDELKKAEFNSLTSFDYDIFFYQEYVKYFTGVQNAAARGIQEDS